MFGWIIPAPFAMPPMRTAPPESVTSRCAILGFVSVVMIARDASSQPASASLMRPIAGVIRPIGIETPMTPVLATATSSGSTPRSAPAAVAIASASRSPCGPVQAFALPEFTTIPRRCPRATFFFVTRQGDAITWFVVKTAAA